MGCASRNIFEKLLETKPKFKIGQEVCFSQKNIFYKTVVYGIRITKNLDFEILTDKNKWKNEKYFESLKRN